MKRVAATVVALLVLLSAGCQPRPAPATVVIVSTSLLEVIVNTLGGNRVKVKTVAPAVGCPGQFDVSPVDVVAASRARLILSHGWEPWFPNFAAAVNNAASGQSNQPRFVISETRGNWMIPEVHKAAVAELAALLAELEPRLAESLPARAARYEREIDSVTALVRGQFAGRRLPAVIASDKQAPFLEWLGFRVVATYTRTDDLSAGELTRLARQALDDSVRLVVDNLQSGPDAGFALASALKVAHVTITNFPLHGNYPEALLANAGLLSAAVEPALPRSE